MVPPPGPCELRGVSSWANALLAMVNEIATNPTNNDFVARIVSSL
jgi:hypothetical protein